MAKKNFLQIHYLRIMACLMVILIHISATPVVSLSLNSPTQLFFIFMNHISKPAVPIFIFISGFLLHNIYKNQKIQLITYYKKRLPKLLLPYVLWCTVYYALYAYFGYYPKNLIFFLKGVLQGTFIYHLYFMVIIIQFYFLYPIFQLISKKINESKLLIFSLIIQLSVILVIFPMKDRLFITYLSYFVLGMWVNTKAESFTRISQSYKTWFLAFTIVGAFSAFLYWNDLNQMLPFSLLFVSIAYVICSLLAIVALYMSMEGFSQRHKCLPVTEKKIAKLSGATQFIYFAHPLFIIASDLILTKIGFLSISLRAVIAFMTILVFLVPFAYLIQDNKIRRVLTKQK